MPSPPSSLLAACEEASLPVTAGIGPDPELPAPNPSWVPTVNIASVVGWGPEQEPVAAQGLEVEAFAEGLAHPRWLEVLPNGDVLVAESDGPPRPEDDDGIRGWVMGLLMEQAGSGTPSANRISLLRDADGDGVAETKTAFLEGLNSPFGMALVGDQLYVANTDALVRFPYRPGQERITEPGEKVTDLPGGALNHHWTKSLIASPDGQRLYVGVGSNSNVAENGIEAERERAAVWEIDPATGQHTVYASGLRNPVGLAWEPVTGALWTSVNERDEIGSDLVPDYMTSLSPAGSMAGPTATMATTWTTGSSRQQPDLVARRSSRTMRWARTPPPWVWPIRPAPACRASSAGPACSWASTARGTATRPAATR